MNTSADKICTLSFDIEEWFQVENLKRAITRNDWKAKKSSVVKNTDLILEILDKHNIYATFFILGWVAEKNPGLVKKISSSGHEIASHGMGHELTYNLTDKELEEDISISKKILEDLSGKMVQGYRAPNFSVNDRLVRILIKNELKYDSSYNPFSLNKRYGSITMSMKRIGNIFKIEDRLFEIPISSLNILSFPLPFGGGAYFRIIPSRIFIKSVKNIIYQEKFYNFYLHPWEFEPDQPRIKNIKLNYKIRHYTGLSKTLIKFDNFLYNLKDIDCQFMRMSDYLSLIENGT